MDKEVSEFFDHDEVGAYRYTPLQGKGGDLNAKCNQI